MPERRPQMFVFTYHKSGTSLFAYVMGKVAEAFGLSIAVRFGQVWSIDPQIDIVSFPHSLIGFTFARPYRAIRVVRDPRDIWVSGYLYHRHCEEGWCVNADLDPTPPIRYPRVDFAFQHRPERWKRRYLASLDGKSYRQNLLDRDQAAGLTFELEHYTAATLDAMRSWQLTGPAVMTVRLEDLMADYDAGMLAVFRHLGFDEAACARAVQLARSEDVARMDDATLAARPRIHTRTLSKWRTTLSPAQVAGFEARHGDLVTALGYQLAGTLATAWDRPRPRPPANTA